MHDVVRVMIREMIPEQVLDEVREEVFSQVVLLGHIIVLDYVQVQLVVFYDQKHLLRSQEEHILEELAQDEA
ncbi:hypothetical protein MRX96_047896 [Rhipicephalus microplus]